MKRPLLPRYFQILNEERNARYLDCKQIPVVFNKNASTDSLWMLHNKTIKTPIVKNTKHSQTLLDLKIELASRLYTSCCFCERQCMVDRRTQKGECGVQHARIASEFLHYGEESLLVPSYTIFFSGCTLHCVFCQNWDISQHQDGVEVKPADLSLFIEKRKNQGAKNVNWVGGDPTSNLLYILMVLNECTSNLPQIWNSNMYCSTETINLLDGIIDVYLTDFKYGNDTCAHRLSKVENYSAVIQRNHALAYKQGEVIIRHLVMPNHTNCCSTPILYWIKQHMPDAAVNIMAQYRPEYQASIYDDINRPVSKEELLQIKKEFEHLQLHEV